MDGIYLSSTKRRSRARIDRWLVRQGLDWQLPGAPVGRGGQAGMQSTDCVCPPGALRLYTENLHMHTDAILVKHVILVWCRE